MRAVSTRPDAAGPGIAQGADLAGALGRRLLEDGVIDEMALRRAERAQLKSGERLDVVLTRLGLVAEDRLAATVADMLGLALVAEHEFPSMPLLEGQVEPSFLRANRIVPLALGADRLVIALANPYDTAASEALAFLLDKRIEHRLATANAIDRALERLHGSGKGPAEPDPAAARPSASHEDDDVRRLQDLASEAPIIRLVQDIIERGVEARASDIHLEPRVDHLRVRYRIDGQLHTVDKVATGLAPGVTSRLKIMARLDIAERRLPQDGRMKSVVRGREIDLRVSTMPTIHGESCALRILDRSATPLDFSTLGFAPQVLAGFRRLLEAPHGIVLVTGPTGSGKTTTLYTALDSLDSEAGKIFTVEDPIEYQLPEINQIQVQPRIGLTFAHTLRSILRQDPDVIMIGEIRDLETAQIAIQASLTGHLVLSTVHTNSAAATITRLLDMGVESYLLASSVSGILAQRLVRRLCRDCSRTEVASPALLDQLNAGSGHDRQAAARTGATIRRKVGCPACRGTGYDGRSAIGELLCVGEDIRRMIHTREPDSVIEAAAAAAGMTTLHQDGIAKVLAGETTLEEVLRVTRLD